MTKPIDIIYARDNNHGIGIYNQSNKFELPWNISVDTKYFNNITSMTSMGTPNENCMNAVIMGKNTWNSIDEKLRPLPNRVNIIISTTIKEINNLKHTFVCSNLQEGYMLANSLNHVENIFVIGGAKLYEEAIKMQNYRYIYENVVDCDYNCNIKLIPHEYGKLISKKTFKLMDTKTKKIVSVTFNKMGNQNNHEENSEEQNYLDILEQLITEGEFRKTRNANTWSLFNKSIEFDLDKGFPLLTTKKVSLKAIFEELLWFLKGDTNAKHLNDKGVGIWNHNTSREFLDKNNLSHYDVYDIGPMYGFNMMHYGTEYKGMNENYDGKGFNQLNYVLNLIKNDPNSRRIIMSTFNPGQASQGVLYPCHGLITQFYVTNGKLHLVTYQR
ncbi:thymidylate synthase [Catovirus CTV1]|uniref:thymidylate synthase n=1 Tax=Catovirus CTV1 TaxID=1977631 RepID=A0A1V0SBZ3_9VIRU|nr:thymidylate synthase [Catovirus CTV1]